MTAAIAFDYAAASAPLDAWPIPQLIESALLPVKKLDPDLLPDELRDWIVDIAERTSAPVEFVAVSALTALSSIASKRNSIRPKKCDSWIVSPNLWGAIVGRPSAKKSPAIAEATRSLQALNQKTAIEIAAKRQSWQLLQKVQQLGYKKAESEAAAFALKQPEKAKQILSDAAPASSDEPKPLDFIVNDCTVEALQVICQNSGAGVLTLRDELSGWLAALDKAGQEHSRAFYLEAWNGTGSFTVHRITREQVQIERLALSVLGGIQPSAIANLIHSANTGGRGDDGLLQRFNLLVWPDTNPVFELIDRVPNHRAEAIVQSIFDKLAEGATDSEYRFDEVAQGIFNEWLTTHENRLRQGSFKPSLESHLGKYAKLVAALALIFKKCRNTDLEPVCEVDLMRAIAWAEFLESHALRLYSSAKPEEFAAKSLSEKIEKGLFNEPMNAREIAKRGWSNLPDSDAVCRAIEILAELDWVRVEMPISAETGRPKSEIFVPNPRGRKSD